MDWHWINYSRRDGCDCWRIEGYVTVTCTQDGYWLVRFDHEQRQRDKAVRRASTAWLALVIVRGVLGQDVPAFCDECGATEGMGV